jgi:hypothetical protein
MTVEMTQLMNEPQTQAHALTTVAPTVTSFTATVAKAQNGGNTWSSKPLLAGS